MRFISKFKDKNTIEIADSAKRSVFQEVLPKIINDKRLKDYVSDKNKSFYYQDK